MQELKIEWIGWIKRLKRWQAQAIVIAVTLLLILALLTRLTENSHPTSPNRFDYALLIYYLLAASPIGEQLGYVAFPKNQPRFQYQVTSWRQWGQALFGSLVIFVLAMVLWPPIHAAGLSFYLILATVVSFTLSWAVRWWAFRRQGDDADQQ
ncbi:hypothetical protein PUF88_04280 [Lactobacillaceae bacterium L1_55_11]|nr:hypothetical protein [Lactobacillaceae bacterium L1_55_11]